MAAAASVMFWVSSLLFFNISYGQKLGLPSMPNNGICKSMFCNSAMALRQLEKCVVVMGNLLVVRSEKWGRENANLTLSFPKLREVTGYMIVYRVHFLRSLERMFPNLTRIRGQTLYNDFALTINDNENLKEIGLYSLIKIDRGGVSITGNPKTCYTDTIDWEVLAPFTRHVISPTKRLNDCNTLCTCSTIVSVNRCWSLKKCQRFLKGPESEICHHECLGCRNTNPNECSLCRHYTYKGQCVSKCPKDTILLPASQYCITEQDCRKLDGWKYNSSCVLECPVDYAKRNRSGVLSCEKCATCQESCGNQMLLSLEDIQKAERCVFINGSLIIHIRDERSHVMNDLNKYLRRIQEVEDHILINGSFSITSLGFLSSLKRIGGRYLTKENYSLVIENLANIQSLFTAEVLKTLKVDHGHLGIKNNPKLCMSDINTLLSRFPAKKVDLDIPYGFNGYTAECNETSIDVKITVVNETSALLRFITSEVKPGDSSTVLYTRLSSKITGAIAPESCSQSEWTSIPVTARLKQYGWIDLFHLKPASTYAVCVETANSKYRTLTRTKIINFTTLVGQPEPPFIIALTALSSEAVAIRWVDHRLYRNYITHYELYISLIEIETKDILLRDHCKKIDDLVKPEPHRHTKIMRPPLYYERGCDSMCGVHSTLRVNTVVDDSFDICSSLERGCDTYDEYKYKNLRNESHNYFVKTLFLNVSAPRSDLNVTGLAPYSDYRFILRSCSNTLCSRSARGVVRTFALENEVADKPKLLSGDSIQPGYVSVEWNHPNVSNGPILSYFIEVTMNVKVPAATEDISRQVWCVPSNTTSVNIKPEISYKYFVKVCSTTLAFTYACSNEIRIEIKGLNTSVWWAGLIFGIFLYLTPFAIGFLWRSRVHKYIQENSDDIPLVDCTSVYRNESEPPVVMSDFTPLYLIQLDNNEHKR